MLNTHIRLLQTATDYFTKNKKKHNEDGFVFLRAYVENGTIF